MHIESVAHHFASRATLHMLVVIGIVMDVAYSTSQLFRYFEIN